jgi:prepilin-type N-terminal cleavage/methylation domain-containing protein
LNKRSLHRFPRVDAAKGFTLIELIVTLLIISVVIGFVLPKIGNRLYSSDLKHSLRELKAILSVARSMATSERIPRRIVCDIPNGEIRIERELRNEGEEFDMVEYEPDNSVLMRTYRLPDNVKIEDVITETGEKEMDGEAYLRINPNGTIAGNFIHLRKEKEQFTLNINPLTGKVTIEEGYIEEYKIADEDNH